MTTLAIANFRQVKSTNYISHITTVIILCAAVSLMSCGNSKDAPPVVEDRPDSAMSQQQLLERGRYLVSIIGCNDCHSPKKMGERGPEVDETRLLSGYQASEQLPPLVSDAGWASVHLSNTAFVGPWGTSFAANLTPHETGIGNWTLENFSIAMKEGKFKGLKESRSLLPPMSRRYKLMKDEDVRAIYVYLMSLTPIDNLVPMPIAPK